MRGERYRLLAFWVFWPALAFWTWKLVEPKPLPEEIDDWFSSSMILRIAAAKTLHAIAYAFLAVTAGIWLPKRRPILTFALSLLMLHGVATEIIQTQVGRTGRAYDVIIDWTGLGLGLFAGRTCWRPLWRKI